MLNSYALEQRINGRLRAAHVPGLAVAIVHDHEVIYARGFGVTSVEDGGLPVTPQTLFRIGSVTKPLTGTAIMRLVDQGLVRLDAPVREYLPWFRLSEPGAAERVSVRMLLTHTAGIPISGIPLDPQTVGSGDPEALAARIRDEIPHLPLVAQPGTLWSYSNGGIHILGYIIEVVTGIPYTQSMRELVFAPLDMSRTTFEPSVAMTYPLAQSHNLLTDGSLRVQHRFANYSAHYPSGQTISSVLDLTNFALLHLQQGSFRGSRVLSPEAVVEMHQAHVDFFTIPSSGYGLTFFVGTHKALWRVAHGGAISTFGANFDLVPETGTAVILLYNRRSADLAANAIVDEIFDQLLPRPADAPPSPIKPDRNRWQQYVGAYLGPWAGLACVAVMDDQLVLEWNGERVPLASFRDDLYAGQRPSTEQRVSVGFYPPAAGETVSPYIVVNAMPCRRIDHDVDTSFDRTHLQAYIGTYGGLHTFRVCVEADHLVVRTQEADEWAVCISLGKGRFACRYGLLVFAHPIDGVSPTMTVGGELTLKRTAESAAPSTA